MSSSFKLSSSSCFLIIIFTLSTTFTASFANLLVGYYYQSCPSAEAIVKSAVDKALSRNPGLGAGIIRMHFHDCFIRGCDASVLLDGDRSEKAHLANNPSLRGFEVIDEAKALLEVACPKTVSCADIIAFAARDSTYKLGRINYVVPSGRRDGRISLFEDIPANLPGPNSNAKQLEENFGRKKMTLDEMVTLSGAHSIGVSHCSSFKRERLYNFSSTSQVDPSMDRNFAKELRKRCPAPKSGAIDNVVPLDGTSNKLDYKYYLDLKNRRGVLTSDQTLFTSSSTSGIVRKNAKHGATWAHKFAEAMVKMGYIDVITGNQGEIRNNCRVVNY